MRAQIGVDHLTLTVMKTPKDVHPSRDDSTDPHRLSVRILAGVLVSELTTHILAGNITITWRSWLAILWLCPLLIKLVSIAVAIDWGPLESGIRQNHLKEWTTSIISRSIYHLEKVAFSSSLALQRFYRNASATAVTPNETHFGN